MSMDPEEQRGLIESWHERRLDVPLVMVEAPFRDLGPPCWPRSAATPPARHTS